MTKLAFFKVEIAVDDDVKAEDVKAALRERIRSMGRRENFGDPVEGQSTADRAVMFDAASVKTWVSERKRGAAGKPVAKP